MFALSASQSRAADSIRVLKNYLQIKRRAANDLEHSAVAVCCCERFAQLVEQARVLDGDDGLGGKIL